MKTASNKIDVASVAKLANLKLTDAEEKVFEKQLSEILNYFNELGKVDSGKVEPVSNITGIENVNREDEPKPSLSQEDALSNAPKSHNGYFVVDAILENYDS